MICLVNITFRKKTWRQRNAEKVAIIYDSEQIK